MLQAAAEQPVALDLPKLAVKIVVTAAGERRARDGHGDAGDGKAALFLGDRLAFAGDDNGVEHDDGLADAVLLVAIDDHEALEDADLGRGKAATGVLIHDMGHLLGQALEALVIEIAGLAYRVEQRVGRLHD